MKDKDGNQIFAGLGFDGKLKYFKPTIRRMRDRKKYPQFRCDRPCPETCHKGKNGGCNDRQGNY